MKKYIRMLLLFFTVLTTLTSCYEEPDLFDDLLVSNGKVAQIAVLWLGDTKVYSEAGVLQPGITVAAATMINVNIEYTSEIKVKEFRVYSSPTTTGVQTLVATLPAGSEKYDTELRNYVVKVPVKAPETKNATIVLFAEVITENNLPSSQRNVTLKTNP